jgi:hypothetical protein
MGLDISAHAVDAALFRDRLEPFLLDRAPIDDLIDRAAEIRAARTRANAWGLAVTELSHELHAAQRAVAKTTTITRVVRGKGLAGLARLFGAKAKVETVEVPETTPGLPGFDTDREVWGRPFFIVGADSAQVIADLDRYLAAAARGEAAVDALVREMLARLDDARTAQLPGLAEHMADTIRAAPLLTTLQLKEPVAEEGEDFDVGRYKAAVARQAETWRTAIEAADLDATIEIETDFGPQETSMRDLQAGLPLELASFAASLMPGWMGRGRVYATALLEKIGAPWSDLFEEPAPLFRRLIERAPAVRDRLASTITDNFSLGGFAPPEKVGALVERLEANREALIFAWVEPEERPHLTDAYVEQLSTDYLKIIEPARYALKHGYGYLEAAEIYSGFLGAMN